FGLGMVIGPGLGAGLALFGPRVPELFAAGLCLANFALAVAWLPESLPEGSGRPRQFQHPLSPDSLRAAAAPPGAPVLFGIFFLVTLGFAVLEGTFPLAAERLFGYGESRIYGLFVYMGLVAVVVQGWLVGRLARRVSEPALVLAGAAGLTVGLAWIPFAGGVRRRGVLRDGRARPRLSPCPPGRASGEQPGASPAAVGLSGAPLGPPAHPLLPPSRRRAVDGRPARRLSPARRAGRRRAARA